MRSTIRSRNLIHMFKRTCRTCGLSSTVSTEYTLVAGVCHGRKRGDRMSCQNDAQHRRHYGAALLGALLWASSSFCTQAITAKTAMVVKAEVISPFVASGYVRQLTDMGFTHVVTIYLLRCHERFALSEQYRNDDTCGLRTLAA